MPPTQSLTSPRNNSAPLPLPSAIDAAVKFPLAATADSHNSTNGDSVVLSTGDSGPGARRRPVACPYRPEVTGPFWFAFTLLMLRMPIEFLRLYSIPIYRDRVYLLALVVFAPFTLFSLASPIFVFTPRKFYGRFVLPCFLLLAAYHAVWFYWYFGWAGWLPDSVAHALSFGPKCGERVVTVGTGLMGGSTTYVSACGFWQLIREFDDTAKNPGDEQISSDTVSITVCSIGWLIQEHMRWSPHLFSSNWRCAAVCAASVLLGPDVAVTYVLYRVWTIEESTSIQPRRSVNFSLYWVVSFCIWVWLWFPSFMSVSWNIVHGVYETVPMNGYGTRAFWVVYGFGPTIAFNYVRDITPECCVDPKTGVVTKPALVWLARCGFIVTLCSHVGAGWSLALWCREFTPLRSFKAGTGSVNKSTEPLPGITLRDGASRPSQSLAAN